VKRKTAPETSVKVGGMQIDYPDQDPRIHAIWLEEMRKAGVPSRMGRHFDEAGVSGGGA
jgi:hypothetical protein